mmetsp:Transcript_53017/g.94622  ORF Transcript_53017/g.94622 Transcript_53017/m.94622 type:complete len:200 (-) Transcript_53017:3580-4179(-)
MFVGQKARKKSSHGCLRTSTGGTRSGCTHGCVRVVPILLYALLSGRVQISTSPRLVIQTADHGRKHSARYRARLMGNTDPRAILLGKHRTRRSLRRLAGLRQAKLAPRGSSNVHNLLPLDRLRPRVQKDFSTHMLRYTTAYPMCLGLQSPCTKQVREKHSIWLSRTLISPTVCLRMCHKHMALLIVNPALSVKGTHPSD